MSEMKTTGWGGGQKARRGGQALVGHEGLRLLRPPRGTVRRAAACLRWHLWGGQGWV